MKRFILSGLIILWSSLLEAGSFQAPSIGARATGMGGAYVAAVDDPLAIYWNPAGLSQVKGKEIILGCTFVKGYASFRTLAGQLEKNQAEWQPIPNMAFSFPVNETVALGVGFYTPFGLKQEWSEKSVYRFSATKSTIALNKLHTGVSWQLHKDFIVGAGIGADWAEIETKQFALIPLPFPPFFVEGDIKLKGKDQGFSGNLGFLWLPADKWKIGGVWRSATETKFSGDAKLNFPAPVGYSEDTFKLGFTFPQVVSLGVSYIPSEKWLFSTQVDWTDWSVIKKLDLNFDINPDQEIARDWKDTYSFHLGMERKLKENLSLRAGYMWDPSPIPGETLDPLMFDNSVHRFSVGLGYKLRNWELSGAYMYSEGIEKEARNSKNVFPTNGDYSGISHLGEISLAYRF